MILLDTNVVSELMQPVPAPALLRWMNQQPRESVWLTSITVMEVRFGIERLAHGRRKQNIGEAFQKVLDEDLDGRVLAFDRNAAEKAGEFAAMRRAVGRPVEFRDAEIAGTVVAHGAVLATRNGRDFEGWNIRLADPWHAVL